MSCSLFLFYLERGVVKAHPAGSLAYLSRAQRILAQGSCQIDHAIESLEGPEAYDTANIMVEYENGKTAIIDVCRQAVYG